MNKQIVAIVLVFLFATFVAIYVGGYKPTYLDQYINQILYLQGLVR